MIGEFEGNERRIMTNVDLASMKKISSCVISNAAVKSSKGDSHLLNKGKLIALLSFRGTCAGAAPKSWRMEPRCEASSLAY